MTDPIMVLIQTKSTKHVSTIQTFNYDRYMNFKKTCRVHWVHHFFRM